MSSIEYKSYRSPGYEILDVEYIRFESNDK